ncbi:hypothetical protein JXM83_00945 [Candidatus Woesearchaeota archaeon]|nr:hypothetical protein [Candidatus Woesearchaeota archaeon]
METLTEEVLKPVLEKLNFVTLGVGFAKISLRFELYDLESIYSAAYSMFDKASFFFDGDSQKAIVYIFAKKPQDLYSCVLEFNNHLINYSYYKIRSSENKKLKEFILSKSLFGIPTEESVSQPQEPCDCEIQNCDEDVFSQQPSVDDVNLDDFEVEDLDSIRVPWEDKNDADLLESEREKLDELFKEEPSKSEQGKKPVQSEQTDDGSDDFSIPWSEEDIELSESDLAELKKLYDDESFVGDEK